MSEDQEGVGPKLAEQVHPRSMREAAVRLGLVRMRRGKASGASGPTGLMRALTPHLR